MNLNELEATARQLVGPAKGILAADESTGTIGKRLASVGVESNEANRRAYREMLFTTPGLGQFISGVILYDETLRQNSSTGTPLREVLVREGIIPGIKVDAGAKPLAGFPREKITEGLDRLRERLAEYAGLGARFAKWRAVITIGRNTPTQAALDANAHALARYATLCQEAGLVPIVEPEVLMDGDHTIERAEEVTGETLHRVFDALHAQRVVLEAMLLKPNLVVAGKDCPQQPDNAQIASATVRCMRRHVPAAVPGLVFLSGGLSETRATELLNAMNRLEGAPWQLSFSFGRALQHSALKTWAGKMENVGRAQQLLHQRAAANAAARSGAYASEVENQQG